MSRMAKRIVFGAIMIAIVSALLWGDWALEQRAWESGWGIAVIREHSLQIAYLRGLPLAALIAIVAGAGVWELSHLGQQAGLRILPVSGLVGTIAVVCLPYWTWVLCAVIGRAFPMPAMPLAVPLAIALVFAEQMIRFRTDDALRRMADTALTIGYLGGCGMLVLWIRMDMAYGVPVLVVFLAAVKFTDIGAYFVGTAFGRHKLIPWLSPGKSWEGLIGGLAAGAAAAVVAAWLLVGTPSYALWRAAVFGAACGLAGQFGDLCESLLKRSAGAKDSGAVVPEFGGVLDIIDSILMAAPVAVVLLGFLPLDG